MKTGDIVFLRRPYKEESLIEGVRNLDAAAYELLDGICLFCSTQELRYLTDAELIETIYAQ